MNSQFSIIVCGLFCCVIGATAGCQRETPSPATSISAEPVAESDGPDSDSNQSETSRLGTIPAVEGTDRTAPPPDIATLHAAGLDALEVGETDAAYDYARQAMRLDNQDPQVIFLMAMVLAERHRFPEAIDMLEEVAETTPEARLPAIGQTADWLVRYGDWAEAEDRYLEILKQVPGSVLVHRNLARLLIRQGRRVEAAEHLDQLCHLGDVTESELRSMLAITHPLVADADDAALDPIGALGMARSEIARNDWQAARSRLRQEGSPGPWETALLGRANAVLEDVDSLRSWIVQTDASVDVSPDAWYAKGVYAASVGEHAVSIRCFAETVLRDPTDRDAYSKMAQSLEISKAIKEADAAEQRATQLEKTRAIGSQLAGPADRDQQSVLQLSALLRELQRPLEALGWRGVWLTYANESQSVSESELQQVLDEIVQERTELLEKDQTRAPTNFVLCGVNVDALPTPDEVNERLKSLATDP